ncbi:alpha-ketoacid dehydrogenase subunit beta [Dermatophilus congolensis]|uniref:alpha-ketoacid dehydrogenase subunit beta n=1 Tax=Dermatophilus congolensis TaxID=1863 RepID=UPI001AAF2537|nr:alpha-ketoacid dehydrogenase subunit beta [Dermatophilus congolensis]MBO3142423.1 alpha-ketoacid dehydrogenase subunit beta [Dermatophilus congolensis]MBO3151412.1 alpha-ketoacid dehydrogenase subunit beta [Dermatophilus congolensis]MBO3161584.1 alpha-ketoacid dehydrogenase subunit beta [Dermatophilus congolensis]MBO3162698.1 alpha-ketoacid dehydrogenase subunit beta [Dermatophilus congolensis]MBO3176252.1 alpha-ketoacid dehydrogenase subunit beta [Dermatophilus congolensis]
MAELTLAQAITAALDLKLAQDPTTLIFGEDVGHNGGVFRITDGLQATYGQDRVFNTPLAESGIMGLALGLANEGWRPLPELQFGGFVFEAMDAIAGQIARFRYRYGGTRSMPMVIRAPFGGGVHTPELHSDNIEGLLSHIPGLRVVIPATAYDAKGLMISAIEDNDPVFFLEHLRMYRTVKGEVPDGHYTVPLDKANIVREGTDISIIAYGLMVHEALNAATTLANEGINAEVIDLRTVSPIDMHTVLESVEKTHRAIACQEAQRQSGITGQLISEITERAFMTLDAPVGRVTAPDTTFPFGMAESIWMPNAADIVETARKTVQF